MLRFVIFISIYLAVYGGMHFYFYQRLRHGFALTRRQHIALRLYLLVMVFGPMIVRGLESLHWHGVAVPFAVLTYSWMGALFMAASLFFFADITRYLLRLWHYLLHRKLPSRELAWRPLVIGVLSVSFVAAGYGYLAAREIHLDTVRIVSDKLPKGEDHYRMVQLSDIHLGVMTDEAWLARIVDEVNRLQPDLIVTTGDIIDSRIASALPYQKTLARLQARDGKYAVAGNHEFFAGIDNSVAYMEKAGFVMLRNDEVAVKPWLHLLGVDDREARLMDGSDVDHEQLLMARSQGAALNILLKHQPVVHEESIGKFDLQLAGHLHQGQIFPFRLLTWIAYPVAMGLTDLGQDSRLYVNRGTGTWGPPMRVLAPPEITVFEFVRASSGQ